MESISEIYGQYNMFHQSGGVEQSVYNSTTGSFERRSVSLCRYIESTLKLPENGKLLDIGCANGETLRAFGSVKNQWDLYGHDLGTRYLDQLKKIPGFKELYSGDFSVIKGKYNLITIIHALEHFIEPAESLRRISSYFDEGGYLFIQIPHAMVNPFDLIIADHVSHFSMGTLQHLISLAGFIPEEITDTFLEKELTVLARPGDPFHLSKEIISNPSENIDHLTEKVEWLEELSKDAKKVSQKDNKFGIFGTSISGTWLASLLDHFDFFVDEDPARIGQSYMGRPILSPSQIPLGSNVYLPLIPKIAERVAHRLKSDKYDLYLPPALSKLKMSA